MFSFHNHHNYDPMIDFKVLLSWIRFLHVILQQIYFTAFNFNLSFILLCYINDKDRVSIRKTFAQFLRNKTQIFSFVAHQFCAKKQQFAQSFAKLPYSAFSQLEFCTIPQFRYNHICVFLGIERFFAESEFWKNLVLECLAFGHFNLA